MAACDLLNLAFGMGGELDIPFLLSRYFGLRSMATLYGLRLDDDGRGGGGGVDPDGPRIRRERIVRGHSSQAVGRNARRGLLMLGLPAYPPSPLNLFSRF